MATIKNRHVKAIIQLRRATETEWYDYNPILRLAEPALSTDVYKLKIGDGVHRWRDIEYLGLDTSELIELLGEYATKEYVDENGGKIDSISVNGTAQVIDEYKNIDINNIIIDCGSVPQGE